MGSQSHSSSSHRDKDKDRDRDSHHHSSSSSNKKHHRSSREGDDDDSKSKKHRSSSSSSKHHESSSSRPRDSRTSSSSRSHHRSGGKRNDAVPEDDEDQWVEKDAVASAGADSLPPPPVDSYGTFKPGETAMRGEEPIAEIGSLTDGYGEGEDGSSRHGGRGGGAFGAIGGEDDGDLFSAMGTARVKKPKEEKVDPSQMMGQSSRELNKAHWQGVPNDPPLSSSASTSAGGRLNSPAPGSTGSSWRMVKLRRTYEMADEEGRPVEEIAMERYDSLEAFNEAVEEKRVLDERKYGGRGGGGSSGGRAPLPPPRVGTPTSEGRKFVYTDFGSSAETSRPSSRNSFRRPGEALERTNSQSGRESVSGGRESSRPSTPVPGVFTPPISRTPRPSALSQSAVVIPDPTTSLTQAMLKPVLSQSDLNKLQAKVLKAKLMGNDDAAELEKEYESERVRASEASSLGVGGASGLGESGQEVRMIPTLDGRGRLYDVGTGGPEEEAQTGKRKKKDKPFESHDPKTGERIRHNADDDSQTLDELVRQERFSAGAQDQKSMDYEMASRIAGDGRFKNDLDYFDENADQLARKKMKSDVLKKAFAVQDYAKTKKALDNCTLCFGDEGQPPKSAVVALGTRAYLGLLDQEELVPGHCRIVPIQHHFSSLDADDETWDEIKNFMKTLMQTFAEQGRGVVFFESCISLKHQRHTCIEAVPVPFDLFDEIPAYFSEAIDNSEQEWSQHKKRINFTPSRPFRRSLVPNLPYFMVQWDYKGEKGYGHIIEGVDDAPDRDADGEEQLGEMGDKGGGEFTRYFAQEIIGNVLELEPRQWRKPRRVDFRRNDERIKKFLAAGYDKYNWTKMLEQK